MAVRVVTDSASDLPPELCEELGIEVVPLTIRFGEEEFVDRKELTTEQFWSKMRGSSVLPETAAPSVGAFEETFRRLADEGADGIICVNLSAALSATMQSAQVAAKALDGLCPIEIVDSTTVSMALGQLVLHAARRAREGADLATITAEVEDRRDRTHILATLDTLDNLRKGGRIGSAAAILGSVLSVKPLITVEDGVVEAVGKVRTRSKALQAIVDRVPRDGIEELSVVHAEAPDLEEFLTLLDPVYPRDRILVAMIGPVIGVHGGPRVIGIGWIAQARTEGT